VNPGGHLLLSTPNYESSWMWRDIPADPRGRPPVHLTYWTRRSLEMHLKRVGFTNVDVRTYSLPLNAARRSAPAWIRPKLFSDYLLRAKQRMTLLALAERPRS
jgi:hypothetical protein